MSNSVSNRYVSAHDPMCPAHRPHVSGLCQHDKATSCGVCVHECLCDLLAVVRAQEQLNATSQRIEQLKQKLATTQ